MPVVSAVSSVGAVPVCGRPPQTELTRSLRSLAATATTTATAARQRHHPRRRRAGECWAPRLMAVRNLPGATPLFGRSGVLLLPAPCRFGGRAYVRGTLSMAHVLANVGQAGRLAGGAGRGRVGQKGVRLPRHGRRGRGQGCFESDLQPRGVGSCSGPPWSRGVGCCVVGGGRLGGTAADKVAACKPCQGTG